ncbi:MULTISPECIES: hypothetical protein [unclassified Moorena]|uniref:hypothetical protein n=1 Tax=unclassified Moorena TaxID=2683338 RepID=UPI0013C9762C|nr:MULTISPECIES: hypothetical protein [unclassified Moorena]NEO22216.1 hypothetical protein [Moorena sp. SIO4A5]NEQ61436.1 hypothetical protein [Moorena sp. SIO4A1]
MLTAFFITIRYTAFFPCFQIRCSHIRCSLLPAPCSLQTQNFVPQKLQTAVLNSIRIAAL